MYIYKNKGFTIIELIVVVAIIAILSVIVTINVAQYINRSKKAATQVEIEQISKAMQIYEAENGCLPGQDVVDECAKDFDNSGSWSTIANKLIASGLIGTGLLETDHCYLMTLGDVHIFMIKMIGREKLVIQMIVLLCGQPDLMV